MIVYLVCKTCLMRNSQIASLPYIYLTPNRISWSSYYNVHSLIAFRLKICFLISSPSSRSPTSNVDSLHLLHQSKLSPGAIGATHEGQRNLGGDWWTGRVW